MFRFAFLPPSFIAEVPELSGRAADGATHREASADVELVLQEWIETARAPAHDILMLKGRLLFA